MRVGLFWVNAYRPRKLEGARVVVSRRMAANGAAVRCDRTSTAPALGSMEKLFVTLLAQKLMRIGREISPSGYSLSERGTM